MEDIGRRLHIGSLLCEGTDELLRRGPHQSFVAFEVCQALHEEETGGCWSGRKLSKITASSRLKDWIVDLSKIVTGPCAIVNVMASGVAHIVGEEDA